MSKERGTERDLTSGHLGRQMLALALPSTVEMALFSVSGVVHAFWLGRLGGMALAAATMGSTLRIALISPMMGLSAGGLALVARHIGAGDKRRADHAVMQVTLLIILFTIPLTILGMLGGRVFLGWMGAKGEVLAGSLAYVQIIFCGLFFTEMLPTMNSVIRGAGHPEYTLRISLVQLVSTAIVEPVLVLGLGPFPALGVRGAAWSVVIGSAAGVGIQLLTLISGKAGLAIHLKDARPDLAVIKSILRIAIPASAQRFLPNLANALLMRLVAALGDYPLTAFSLINRLLAFLQCPGMGIGNAAATMVGQNLGAEKPERAERAAYLGTYAAIGSAFLLFGALNFWPTPILGIFDPDNAVLAIALAAVPYLLFIGMTRGWNEVMNRALGGAGDTLSPMVVNIGALWLVQLPLCWALSQPFNIGIQGIWIGLLVSYVVSAIAMTLRFRQGRWKAIKL